ncbi:MAG: rhodanese-like domain-containing protein [Gammaproteobacteria bacterium]|nr:rhodanese-like domain-containing protein [Gammaproteobacteria bacterium]MDH5653145.1 rhodanese-like domain-containing protein [Gammaproteobacteria bacterium]
MFSNIKELEASQLAEMLNNKADVQVVDIRQPAEVAAGTVPGAEMMPMHTIPLRIQEIKQDKPVVLVCRSGARSAQACMFLAQQGFENVFNLRGGMMGWAGSGLQIGLPQAV